ncbi:TIGR02921 family PEP-CTERM protein [Anabaena subtropica]|uniref:TIGR02921 family PEP-CTERM protein n=1 Tax=Anabaena subtropica FACHB-260 TaxID=2692884 RepID=A0ABR8CVP7_9NOST|nr:TIGR02921 family PEP-CTERM protein [Anabaena subtropica]MBD2347124.1 TIGR02921 family PEP-CTERM protein [Anabaena subtropica FACHB-260]
MKLFWNISFYGIFWLWNLTFLTCVYLGILPFVGVPLVEATLRGDIPTEFSFTFLALIAIPSIASIIGGWRFAKQPLQLIRLFYGVEAPLFVLCLLRLFVIRELTPASSQIMLTTGVCIAAFTGELFWGFASRRKSSLQWVQMLSHTLMLVFGIYAGAVLLFYALPLAVFLVQEFVKFQWVEPLWNLLYHSAFFGGLFLIFIWLVIVGFSATLFIAMPSALSAMYVHSGVKILRAFAADHGKNKTFFGAGAVVVAFAVTFLSLQQQPQVMAFSLLAKVPTNDSDRQTLLAKSEPIRTGLVNAYLSSYRYLSSRQENNHISAMYRHVLGLDKSVADGLQTTYNFLMSPFLYNGTEKDIAKAEKLYADFFDTPLQKAEKTTVSHAVQSTFNEQEVKAGLLNINEKKVWLASQQVTVKEHSDWADVELYEVYKNQTREVQEVFYSFSLPESAVIAGLWLGDTNKLDQRFRFVVSPRGAAQKVYNSQVRRTRPVDPALLEQVGLRHYRLRAFPIPPNNVQQIEGQPQLPTEMHLWLTYKVMGQNKGWEMPDLGERRNIFWTNKTKRIRNGKEIGLQEDAWLEEFIPASGKIQPTLHEVNLDEGYKILAKPLSNRDYILPKNQRVALVIDTSRSMGEHIKELTNTLSWLRKNGFADNDLTNNDADLYISFSPGIRPKRLDDIQQFQAEKIAFYGTIQPQEMLEQFNTLRGDTAYDAVLLLSDEGSYELSKNNKNVPSTPAPLWMVHLGGLPSTYNDGIIKSLQDSGGGVAVDIAEVLQRIATKSVLGDSVVNVVNDYAWYLQKLDPAVATTNQQDDLLPLAARQLILGLSKEIKLDNLKSLDAIHAVAKKYKIVSPYSSMLVLVNDEQRRLLKEAEAESDRFDRKVENGKENLSKPNNPLKVSVPEASGGWLVGVSAIALFILVKRRR